VLLNILKQKTDDEQVKRYAVSYMEGTGSFEYCRKVLATLTERARVLVGDLDGEGEAVRESLGEKNGSGSGSGVLKILDKMAV